MSHKKTNLPTMNTLCMLIGCILTLTQGTFSSYHVRIEPENPFVHKRENVSILCQSEYPMVYCRIKVGSFPKALYLSPKTIPTKEFAYFGNGLDQGHCGITLFNVTDKTNGIIECTPFLDTDAAEESSAKTNITVIQPPRQIEYMITSPLQRNALSPILKENDILEAFCEARYSRPFAKITWYLGDELIHSGNKTYTTIDLRTDLRTVKQTLVRAITWKDNEKDLRCVVGHAGWSEDHDVTSKLSVTYVPRSLEASTEFYGLKLNETQNITVEIFANPTPSFTWMIGKDSQLISGQQHPEGNLIAQWPELLGAYKWKVVLQIKRLTRADVEREYRLVAKNSVGQKSFNVVISTDNGPPFKLSMGSYILIAVIGACVLTFGIIVYVVISQRRKKKLRVAPTSTEKITKLDMES